MLACSCVGDTNVVVRALLPKYTLAAESKEVPFTVRVNAGEPPAIVVGLSERAVGVGGAVTAKTSDAVVSPFVTTDTLALPAVNTSAAEIAAVSCVADVKVVVLGPPFQYTVEADVNPVPAAVRVKAPLPATAEAGVTPVSVAAGLDGAWSYH